MRAEQIFSTANTIAIIGWILLAVAPRWKYTAKIVLSGALPILLSIAYLILIVVFFGQGDGDFGTLAGVMKFFTNEWTVVAAWIHYLAFDLFVGIWEVKDSQKRGISHWFVVPCLFFTLMLGPIGFLLYSILRFFYTRKQPV
jgi:hypothetical protein